MFQFIKQWLRMRREGMLPMLERALKRHNEAEQLGKDEGLKTVVARTSGLVDQTVEVNIYCAGFEHPNYLLCEVTEYSMLDSDLHIRRKITVNVRGSTTADNKTLETIFDAIAVSFIAKEMELEGQP